MTVERSGIGTGVGVVFPYAARRVINDLLESITMRDRCCAGSPRRERGLAPILLSQIQDEMSSERRKEETWTSKS